MRFYVNVDHVATVRQARGTDEPDPVRAAVLVELAGADGITVHLREDRRHVSERDVRILMETVRTGVNLEIAAEENVLDIACEIRPMQVTLVPEKRQELTTEGGLALGESAVRKNIGKAIERLADNGIRTALFIDPDPKAIETSTDLGADAVELHTGEYANADDPIASSNCLAYRRPWATPPTAPSESSKLQIGGSVSKKSVQKCDYILFKLSYERKDYYNATYHFTMY